MRNWFKKKSNWLFLIILGFIIVQQLLLNSENSKRVGQELPPTSYLELDTSTEVIFPPHSGNAIAIFWASWCGPCMLEMGRLKESVQSGKIPSDRIFAINPFETIEEQKRFQRKEKYPFIFINGPAVGEDLGVRATPTTIFIKEKKSNLFHQD